MFAVRRIFRNNQQLINYICTSSVLQCDKHKKMSGLFKRVRKSEEERETKAKVMNFDINDVMTNLRPSKKERAPRKKLFSKAMVSSVEKVASELGGDEEQIKKDLLHYVKTLDAVKEPESVPDKSESQITPKRLSYKEWIEATQMPKEEHEREVRERRKTGRLGIFSKNIMNRENEVQLKIWDSLEGEELAAKSKRSPENYYEELINWTNEGRLWKFPIDNDQGMEVEAATSFTEHVFLEKHLEPWCPKKGPIRKFMEMVLIGLGKNPYLTAKEKRAHIMWFKFYFDQKKKLLQELGAIGPTKLEVSNQESAS